MRAKRRAYNSRNWKVSTPEYVISLYWHIMHKHRKKFDNVLDMGAGDGRFASGGRYNSYVGVEIDKKISSKISSKKISFSNNCVFEHKGSDYSACIGNPPYLRHNELSNNWREKIQLRFRRELGLNLDGRSNLYVYFIILGLQKTKVDGIVSMLVPYEWAFIPSIKPVQEYIRNNKWGVYIYRFNYLIFKDVLTTASISIIDKSEVNGEWRYFDINRSGKIKEVTSFTENGNLIIEHERRGKVWAMRGLSPGAKTIFTLTEAERMKANLTKQDVRPCIISLRDLPSEFKVLNLKNFQKYFISKNKRCWLIRSDKTLTLRLMMYLQTIPLEERSSWTCRNQQPWYKYRPHPAPSLLMSSAFKKYEPLILYNKIKAVAVGSTIGIHTRSVLDMIALQDKLRRFDFSSRLIPREEGLKKIAINQVNSILNSMVQTNNGK